MLLQHHHLDPRTGEQQTNHRTGRSATNHAAAVGDVETATATNHPIV
jgi:hypothetical protein